MRKFIIAIGVLLAFVAGAFIYWSTGNLPANANDKTSKIFVVRKGESIREIGNSLKRENLIRSPVIFFVYIKLNGQDKNIQAGDYKLSPSMGLGKLIESLNHGTLDIWVTIPEGLRAEEIADIFAKDLPSYEESWRPDLIANEGYLFPDTYLIPRDADASMVISIMKNTFNKRMDDAGINVNAPGFVNALIIASIIEKEAKFAGDFPVVSSVIHNRLNDGMALQVDPSVAYALGYQTDTKKWWKQELTFEDLKVESPYNTYKYTGLPPRPISNPGVQAVQAALNPSTTDYLYYISDKTGHIHPAKDSAGHQANIQKYL